VKKAKSKKQKAKSKKQKAKSKKQFACLPAAGRRGMTVSGRAHCGEDARALKRADRDEPGGECGAKRKRAKPRSDRRFTRELLYQNACYFARSISRSFM
jgi:hypothetical protein